MRALNIITRLTRLRMLLVAALLAVSLVSCSTKMSYRFADWLVAWSVDDYIEWDRTQQREFDQRLEQVLLWHQRTQLPRYSVLLGKLQQDFTTPLSRELLSQRLDELTPLGTDILTYIEPDIILLLSTLSDEQTEQLLQNLDKKNERYAQQYNNGSTDKWNKKRIKNVEKLTKRFIGRLTREQKATIANWGEQVNDSRSEWLQNRKNWRNQFDAALKNRQEPQFNQHIRQLFVNSQTLWSEQYRQKIAANTDHAINLIIALQATMTDKQHRHLNKELTEWQRVFSELADEVAMSANERLAANH